MNKLPHAKRGQILSMICQVDDIMGLIDAKAEAPDRL
jgi:hypothetical protein